MEHSKTALVIGTFLPPTMGHKHLIDFAASLVQANNRETGRPYGMVCVLVNSRDCEPIPGYVRVQALREHYDNQRNVQIFHYHGDVPQNPSESATPEEFWNFWKKLIEDTLYEDITRTIGYVVASETYGAKLAEVFDAEFIPANIYREVQPISATDVRQNAMQNFKFLLPEMRSYFQRTVTIFGAESCGKTTMAKYLASGENTLLPSGGTFVPEWAREYLEQTSPECTPEKMHTIVLGQYAAQMAAKAGSDKALIFQDTDLLTTIGYYRLLKIEAPDIIYKLFEQTKSDLYVLMNDKIPFEPDPLRYGGDHRESTMDFWRDLLEEFECKYVTMPTPNRRDQRYWLCNTIDTWYSSEFTTVYQFERT